MAPKAAHERGSNAFAVSPARSGDDVTRLFINSHQPLEGPVAWYEAHLMSDEGLNSQGGLFPGTPVVLCGFNENLGWANTVSAQDLTDIYRLTVNDKNQYKLDEEWTDFETREAKLRIKLFGPFAFKTSRKIRVSKHGPVVQRDDGTFAVAFAGMDEIGQLDQYIALNKASDMTSFMEAMALNTLPSINYIYADKAGNIGFIHNAQYPNRAPGWDYRLDIPGDRSDLIWKGYRPFSDVPRLINPQSGFIYNANNTPVSATDGGDNLRFSELSPELGLQTDETNRSLRIQELSDGRTPIGREALLAMKFDHAYSRRSVAAKVVSEVLASDFTGDEALLAAQIHLAGWDFGTDKDSRFAALGALTVLNAVTEKYTSIAPDSPQNEFKAAVDYLMQHHGKIDVPWGEVNKIARGDVVLPISGAATTLRAVYPETRRGDGTLHMSAGDSYIALVEWDAQGRQSADVVHYFGSAVTDKASVHYNDQTAMFAAQKFRRALITPADVTRGAVETYAPGKRDKL